MKYIRCSNEIFQFENYPLYLRFRVVPKLKFQYGHSEFFDGISAVFTIGYTYQWFQAGVAVTDEKYVFVSTRESKHQIIGEKCLLQEYFDYTRPFITVEGTDLFIDLSTLTGIGEEEMKRLEDFRATSRHAISSQMVRANKNVNGALLKIDNKLSIINSYVEEVPAIKTILDNVKKEVSGKTEFWNDIIAKLFEKFEKDTSNGN